MVFTIRQLVMKIESRYYIFLMLICALLFSLYIYKDYGFGTDEHINRANGGISFNYVLNKIENIFDFKFTDIRPNEFNVDLLSYKDRDYGVAFDLPAMVLERILDIKDLSNQYFMRHLLTNFLFIVGCLYFYFIIKTRYSNYKYGIIGVSFLVLSPRIFAESFYNNKDIVFMSFFIVALYYSIEFIKKINFKNCLLSAFTTGIAIDTRIVGVLLPIMVIGTIAIDQIKQRKLPSKNTHIHLYLYIAFVITVVIALWPWLWSSPALHFYEAIQNMAKFRWLNWVFYRGHYYPSSNLPWHYLPIWILITTPIFYLALSVLGGMDIIKNLIINKFNIYKDNNQRTDLIVAILLFVPIISAILLKSTIYDGWRQFYFLYPLVIYIAMKGCYLVMKLSKTLFYLLFIISSVNITYWMHTNHPYQFVYFNSIAGANWNEKYELDYWGITNVDLLKEIANIDNKDTIKIFGLGNTSIPQAFSLLNNDNSKRFYYVEDYKNSDYVLTNLRFLANNENIEMYKKLKIKCPIINEIKIDNKVIASVFKSCDLSQK